MCSIAMGLCFLDFYLLSCSDHNRGQGVVPKKYKDQTTNIIEVRV